MDDVTFCRSPPKKAQPKLPNSPSNDPQKTECQYSKNERPIFSRQFEKLTRQMSKPSTSVSHGVGWQQGTFGAQNGRGRARPEGAGCDAMSRAGELWKKMHRGAKYFQPSSATLLFQSSLFFTTKEQQWLLSRATSDVTIKILRTQSCAATGSPHSISLAALVGSFATSTRCSCIIAAPSIG